MRPKIAQGWATPIALLCLLVSLSGCRSTSAPRLLFDATVAPDLAALASSTWAEFLQAFGGRTSCFGDVTLAVDPHLSSRAVYDRSTATVTVGAPATAALLRAALVHEWAHHVESQCEAHVALRAPFLVAQGLPPDTSWFDGASWAATPSEQYAEAAVVLVLGRRQLPTGAAVVPAAVAALATWAQDD